MVDPMVVVEYLYEDMKKLVDLPLEKMVSDLSELGAPSEYEPETRKIISELTPNRPDWYSMEGLARALRAFNGQGHPTYKTHPSQYKVLVDPSVEAIRPHTACAVVRGLWFDDGRIADVVLLQEKLIATLGRRVKKFGLGIYPLGAIHFPVRYTTMKPEEIRYVPLGCDVEMTAEEILKEHKKGQQYGHIIEGHGRYPVFVDANKKIMALIPIVNSAETGKVDTNTKEVFIEVSGTDLNACKAALNIIVCTFADMGGTIYQVSIEQGKNSFLSPNLKPTKIKIKLDEFNKILGIGLKEKEVRSLLGRMGYEYAAGGVVVPPYRADVMDAVDVLEDLAIAYGYNNFKPTIPDFFHPGKVSRALEGIDQTMRGMGFMEMKTFILTNKEKVAQAGFEGEIMEISNPANEEYTIIRPNLLVPLLEVFATNKMKGLPQRIYEIGLVREHKKEAKRLVFGSMDVKVEFAAMRGYVQTLASEKGWKISVVKKEIVGFDPGFSCGIMKDGNEFGRFGKVSKEVLQKFGLDFEVYVCEMGVE